MRKSEADLESKIAKEIREISNKSIFASSETQ